MIFFTRHPLSCHLSLLQNEGFYPDFLKDTFAGAVGAVFDIDNRAIKQKVLAFQLKTDVWLRSEGAWIILAFFQKERFQVVINCILAEQDARLRADIAFIGFIKEPDFQRNRLISAGLDGGVFTTGAHAEFAYIFLGLGINNGQ